MKLITLIALLLATNCVYAGVFAGPYCYSLCTAACTAVNPVTYTWLLSWYGVAGCSALCTACCATGGTVIGLCFHPDT